jgi:hypothetical protein
MPSDYEILKDCLGVVVWVVVYSRVIPQIWSGC